MARTSLNGAAEHGLIAGVDEAGRGPLAGPVLAAAVVLDPGAPIEGLRDSKQLTARARERLAGLIRERAHAWSLGWADAGDIDRINILQATLLAMARAVAGLPACSPSCARGRSALSWLALQRRSRGRR